ncbi:MAG: iron-containing redox enzyme family protein [Planctomycetes bacterium]|nr:iron-containing redox enzyme family protein [Planctomycetota bacterium]
MPPGASVTHPQSPSQLDCPPALDADALHGQLASFNQRRLRPTLPSNDWRQTMADDARMRLLEGAFVEVERAAVSDEIPFGPDAVATAADALAWFDELARSGPGQGDRLFPWLSEHADLAAMRWFLSQEIAGEAGFDDLVALTQIKLPMRAKLELARNYWDEMGRGQEAGMHGRMLDRLVEVLALPVAGRTVVEATALANLMVALAAERRYAYQAVGALGVIELTAPGRVALVARGLERLGVSAEGRRYYELHAVLDVKHSEAWNREVIAPLAETVPGAAHAMAEGALMRLHAGRRCFERYRAELSVV